MRINNNLRKLTAAITATAIVATSATPAISYDVSPASFLTAVHQQVARGEFAGAMKLVARLSIMGVKFIVVDGKRVSIEQLEQTLMSGDRVAALIMVSELRAVANSGDVGFVVGNRLITSTGSIPDNFPTSSAG
jgi:hypothetical protein